MHERFTGEELDRMRADEPGLKIIAHPECPPDVIAAADFTGSTSGMINWVKDKRPAKVMLVTECSMASNVAVEVPDVEFIRPCNLCPHMKRISLEDIYDALVNMQSRGDRRSRCRGPCTARCRTHGQPHELTDSIPSLGPCRETSHVHHGKTHLTSKTFKPARTTPGPGDVVIIGAGLAGLFTALKLAPLPVTVIAAAPLGEGASSVWAQGGIAAAVGEGDSTSKHAADTIAAGAGIVDEHMAHLVADEGPDAHPRPAYATACPSTVISKAITSSPKRPRTLKSASCACPATVPAAAIMNALIAAVRQTPSIRVLEGYEADDLIAEKDRVDGVRLVAA